MLALLTSCGRFDLLKTTLESLYENQEHKFFITIHEDGERIGQHASIERFLKTCTEKYYLHLEDDWKFNNSYDWIHESLRIMESDQRIIKVICREDMVHPCDGAGFLGPWTDPWKKNTWYGFGWNPGVTKAYLLKQFIPFPQWEQDLSKLIYEAGYKVAVLEKGVCRHIGERRSTHEN